MQQGEIGTQLHSFKESRLENVEKSATNVEASEGTSAEIMVHMPKNVKNQRKCLKSLTGTSKKKQHIRSSLGSPSNGIEVIVALNPLFLSLNFVFQIDLNLLLYKKIRSSSLDNGC